MNAKLIACKGTRTAQDPLTVVFKSDLVLACYSANDFPFEMLLKKRMQNKNMYEYVNSYK